MFQQKFPKGVTQGTIRMVTQANNTTQIPEFGGM